MVSVTEHFFKQLIRQQVTDSARNTSLRLPESFDQKLFFTLLKEHRLLLFGVQALKKHYPDQQQVIEFLTPFVIQQSRQQLLLGHALLSLTKRMHLSNIPYVILKGAPLNRQLYGNKILRMSHDIDILINVLDLACTHRLLIEAGYELDAQLSKTSPEEFMGFTKLVTIMKDVSYRHRQHRTLVELHWNISQMADCNFGVITDHMRTTVTLCDKDVSILSSEYNFIYLCFHASKHQWERWQWLVDLAVFYRQIPLDWEQLISIAKRHYCLRPLLEAKQLLQCYFFLDLPCIPCARQDTWAIYWRLRFAKKLWKSKTTLSITRCHPYYEVFYQLLLVPRYRQKVTFLWHVFWQGERALMQQVTGRHRAMILITGIFHKCTRLFSRQ